MNISDIIAIILVFIIGYIALTSGLCMVRGVARALDKKPNFLLAILFSGSFMWIVSLSAYLLKYPIPASHYQASLFSALGGFLFGFGSGINHGCGVSTITRLARGEVFMLMTIMGWLISWLAFANYIPGITAEKYHHNQLLTLPILVIISIIILFTIRYLSKQEQKTWQSMLTIGFIAGILFIAAPNWTPSQLLHDISLSWFYNDYSLFPSTARLLIILSLVSGMIIAAIRTRAFLFRFGNKIIYSKHLIAGLLMGMGAVLANGGNDSHLLLGLPTFSFASLISVIFIIIGITVGLKIKLTKKDS